jgi:hypothetical protein
MDREDINTVSSAAHRGEPRPPLTLFLEATVATAGQIDEVRIVATDSLGLEFYVAHLQSDPTGYSLVELEDAGAIWVMLLEGNVRPP